MRANTKINAGKWGVFTLLVGVLLLVLAPFASANESSSHDGGSADVVSVDLKLACKGTGHMALPPGRVVGTFHLDAPCPEVSLLSWLAPDAHAGKPQTLYDRKSENNLPAGDYQWFIKAPPNDCFHQYDLHAQGKNFDVILGGTHKCEPVPTTTTTSTTVKATTTTVKKSTTTTLKTTTTVGQSTTTEPFVASTSPAGGPPSSLPNTGRDVGSYLKVTGAALVLGGFIWAFGDYRRRQYT